MLNWTFVRLVILSPKTFQNRYQKNILKETQMCQKPPFCNLKRPNLVPIFQFFGAQDDLSDICAH